MDGLVEQHGVNTVKTVTYPIVYNTNGYHINIQVYELPYSQADPNTSYVVGRVQNSILPSSKNKIGFEVGADNYSQFQSVYWESKGY